MWPLKSASDVAMEEKLAALHERQAKCQHDGRFTLYGHNMRGYGTCLDCGAERGLDDIVNVYLRKMDAILDKAGIR